METVVFVSVCRTIIRLYTNDCFGSISIFDRLKKTAILVNNFKLSSDELIYIIENNGAFDQMQFNSLSMA